MSKKIHETVKQETEQAQHVEGLAQNLQDQSINGQVTEQGLPHAGKNASKKKSSEKGVTEKGVTEKDTSSASPGKDKIKKEDITQQDELQSDSFRNDTFHNDTLHNDAIYNDSSTKAGIKTTKPESDSNNKPSADVNGSSAVKVRKKLTLSIDPSKLNALISSKGDSLQRLRPKKPELNIKEWEERLSAVRGAEQGRDNPKTENIKDGANMEVAEVGSKHLDSEQSEASGKITAATTKVDNKLRGSSRAEAQEELLGEGLPEQLPGELPEERQDGLSKHKGRSSNGLSSLNVLPSEASYPNNASYSNASASASTSETVQDISQDSSHSEHNPVSMNPKNESDTHKGGKHKGGKHDSLSVGATLNNSTELHRSDSNEQDHHGKAEPYQPLSTREGQERGQEHSEHHNQTSTNISEGLGGLSTGQDGLCSNDGGNRGDAITGNKSSNKQDDSQGMHKTDSLDNPDQDRLDKEAAELAHTRKIVEISANIKKIHAQDELRLSKSKSYFDKKNSKHKFPYSPYGQQNSPNTYNYGSYHKNYSRNNYAPLGPPKDPSLRQDYKKTIRDILITPHITVQDLARQMAETVPVVNKKLSHLGIKASANTRLDSETAALIAMEFNNRAVFVKDAEQRLREDTDIQHQDEDLTVRPPIVTIMGHVDHGKTSLLDAIRSTNVTKGEAGGITQSIGAYMVKLHDDQDSITFIDTPGHESFSKMRARGANVTDIVILVVAADDGVKPQTIEAINHAKSAKVPLIVAVNKIDKYGSKPDDVLQELLRYDVVTDKFNGEAISVGISATAKTNLTALLEAVLIQSHSLNLRAKFDKNAVATVLECRVDKGMGPVATAIIRDGTLKVGNFFVVGNTSGRVRVLLNDQNLKVQEATPAMPVQIIGLSAICQAGDELLVVNSEADARELIRSRVDKQRQEAQMKPRNLFVAPSTKKQLKVVVKADNQGSWEALRESLLKLTTEQVELEILSGGVGSVNESDVEATFTKGDSTKGETNRGLIVAFNVKTDSAAAKIALRKNTKIVTFDVIYDCLDYLKQEMFNLQDPEYKTEILGHALIKELYEIGKVGLIFGSVVSDGVLERGEKVRIIRSGAELQDMPFATIKTLRRLKEEVKEVRNGQECGIFIEGIPEGGRICKVGDIIECYKLTIVKHPQL